MTQINPDLLLRLEKVLGVKAKSIYPRIAKISKSTFLENNLAALILATSVGININRYSTSEERSQIRGATKTAESSQVAPSTPTKSLPVKKSKTVARQKVTAKDNSVFVVHGRDEALRASLFAYLRALGLKPLEWQKAILKAKGNNPQVGNIIDTAMSKVQAVVVLFSPDEEARLKEQFCTTEEKRTEGKLQSQSRPNVLFEAGLALGRHPEKTVIIQVGKVRGFSDIGGMHVVHLDNSSQKRSDLANRLQKIGCQVDRVGTDWMSAGDFSPTK